MGLGVTALYNSEMACGAAGTTGDSGEMSQYKQLEAKVREAEEQRIDKERERRKSLGLPADEGKFKSSYCNCVYLFHLDFMADMLVLLVG
ncbi:hypothetical protein MMC25_001798 [Agyrium rufum]|nr:hypothetical protein [Agyrium rufum]